MAQQGIPGVGKGILHSKQSNKFRLVFVHSDPTIGIIDGTEYITMQVTNASQLGADKIQIIIQDDLTNLAYKGVQHVRELDGHVNVRIEYLDNETVLRTHTFMNVIVEAIEYSPLDYASQDPCVITLTLTYSKCKFTLCED